MDSLGQDRLRSLQTNYRRNRIRLIVLSVAAAILLCCVGFLFLKIQLIKAEVKAEYTHYITEAEAERAVSEDELDKMRALVEEAKARNAAIQAEIDVITSAKDSDTDEITP